MFLLSSVPDSGLFKTVRFQETSWIKKKNKTSKLIQYGFDPKMYADVDEDKHCILLKENN